MTWLIRACPNYCIYGMYGGVSWRSAKSHMEGDWKFCPVCGAEGFTIVSNFGPEPRSAEHLAYDKEQRRRFLYWLHKRPKDFNWQLCNSLPPVPEKPKPVKKRKKAQPEVVVVEANVRPRRTRATQVMASAPPQELARSLSAARHVAHLEIYPGKSPRRRAVGVVASAACDILVKEFLVRALKARFVKLNPYVGTDLVDWKSAVPSGSTFGEGLDAVSREYPHFAW